MPVIHYYDAYPYVQLKNNPVDFSCIVSDNVGIGSVKLMIMSPNGISNLTEAMELLSHGKYAYSHEFNATGRYSFYIKVKDKVGNEVESEYKLFWISNDLDDTDNDGMPDEWELKYGFDPEDPSDAKEDYDGDGYTNLKEYEIGTNPLRDIFMQNVAYRLKDSVWYLIGSVILFLIVLILSMIGKRREPI
jgi:hypothetical protein